MTFFFSAFFFSWHCRVWADVRAESRIRRCTPIAVSITKDLLLSGSHISTSTEVPRTYRIGKARSVGTIPVFSSAFKLRRGNAINRAVVTNSTRAFACLVNHSKVSVTTRGAVVLPWVRTTLATPIPPLTETVTFSGRASINTVSSRGTLDL